MKKRKIAERVVATPAQLDELIEEATVDCHDDNEQASAAARQALQQLGQ